LFGESHSPAFGWLKALSQPKAEDQGQPNAGEQLTTNNSTCRGLLWLKHGGKPLLEGCMGNFTFWQFDILVIRGFV